MHRQARIDRENLPLSIEVRDTQDRYDPWDKRDLQE
jgi:hypothetical protein